MKYAMYEDYKNSASDRLGSVPSQWHVDRLKWSTTGCYNGVWGDEPNDLDDLICIRVADFDRDRFVVVSNPPTIRAIEAGQRRNRILQKNDLLIEKSGGGEKQLVGCVVQFTEDFPAVCSNFVARLPVARECDPRYLTYLHSAIYAARLNYPAIKQTTGIQNLDSGEYLNILVAYPPLDEQQTIARFLDAKTAQIDALVAQKRQLIDKLKEKRQALIARIVTRGLPPEAAKAAGLEPNPAMKDSEVDWLGHLPTHWKVLPMTKYLSDMSDYRGKTPEKTDDGVFLVTARNVRMGYIDYESSQEYVAAEDYDEIMRRGLPKIGDILFTTEAPLGNVALVDREDIALAQRIIRFRMRRDFFHSRFTLYAMLADYFQSQLKSLSTGSTAEGLKASKLSVLRLVAPPVDEQQAIAAFLDTECGHMDGLLATTEMAIERLIEYRQSLISSAVTGKIDVRELA